MATGSLTASNISLKFPKYITTSIVIGDSQCEYLHNHFDPCQKGPPAFICKPGAKIEDVHSLLKFVMETTTSIVLHVGTNDLCQIPAGEAFKRYRALLDTIGHNCPNIKQVYATLILPRSTNRHLARSNDPFVERCNREACFFNNLLRRHCRKTKGLFFVNHGFEWLPSCQVLAANGLHPNFDGVVLIASHLHQMLSWLYTRRDTTWKDHSNGPHIRSISTDVSDHPNSDGGSRARIRSNSKGSTRTTLQLMKDLFSHRAEPH
ncbi:hypothetical protein HPB50_008485 [Hyalomma asiaticum]|uniref:Uncharacterized protein n=1 Tax=Hyalomma asiaticum TaxID=266040 RepID=A0ACB7RWA1_HYAAI|nr:hypothetical protein HPB50_008485 [Hyalomma asiaticum]